MLVLQVVSFPQVSPSKSCMHLTSPMRTTRPAHLTLLDLSPDYYLVRSADRTQSNFRGEYASTKFWTHTKNTTELKLKLAW